MVDQAHQIEGPDITNYWQYFNLERDPFAMSPEEALIYLPSYWEEMLDLVQYLVNYKNQIVVMTGDGGSGKSVLCDLLINQVGDSAHVVKVPGEPGLNVQRLVEFFGDVFSLPWTPDQSIEAMLDEQLQSMQHKDKNCLLVIDNAHLLPTETLEALLYLVGQQSDSQMRFHTVLLGEINLASTIQRMLEPAEESLVHFLSIEPLSMEELQQYLSHRLNASGWQNDNPMSEEIVARIFRLSEGNPARINRIARRFLLDMLNDQESESERASGKKYLTRFLGACLIIAILAVLGLWAWRMSMNAGSQTPEHPTISVNGHMLARDATSLSTPTTMTTVVSAPALPAAVSAPAAVAAEAPPVPVVAPAPVEPVEAPAPQLTPSASTALTAAPMPQAPAPVVQTVSTTPAAIVAPASPPMAPKKVVPVRVHSTPVEVPPERSINELAQPVTPAPVTAAVELPAPVVKPVVKHISKTKPKPAAPAVSDVTAASAPVLAATPAVAQTPAVPKGNYSVQLLNLTDAQSAHAFIQQNNLQGKIRIAKSDGKTVVYYGKYSTMRAASQDIANFSPALMDAGPWPVKMKNP